MSQETILNVQSLPAFLSAGALMIKYLGGYSQKNPST